jgi:hypothetical protein
MSSVQTFPHKVGVISNETSPLVHCVFSFHSTFSFENLVGVLFFLSIQTQIKIGGLYVSLVPPIHLSGKTVPPIICCQHNYEHGRAYTGGDSAGLL